METHAGTETRIREGTFTIDIGEDRTGKFELPDDLGRMLATSRHLHLRDGEGLVSIGWCDTGSGHKQWYAFVSAATPNSMVEVHYDTTGSSS